MGQGPGEVGALLAAAQCQGGPCRYVLMNVGEPLNEQMMKEANENGDRTLDYEGEQRMGPGSPEASRSTDLSLCSQSSWHDDWGVLQAGSVGEAAGAKGGLLAEAYYPLLSTPLQFCSQ